MLRARIRWLALVLTMAVGVGVGPGAGSAEAEGGRAHGGLRVKRKRDIIIVAVAGAAYVSSEFLKDQLTPGHCRWCAGNAFDDGARDAVVWDKRSRANTLSNLTGYALLPGVALGLGGLAAAHDDRFGGWLDDAIVITGAAVVAGNLNQLTKFLAMRERPFQHALAPADKHSLSAVRVGAATGAGLGWGIPMLRRRCPGMTVAATPLESGALVGVGMTF